MPPSHPAPRTHTPTPTVPHSVEYSRTGLSRFPWKPGARRSGEDPFHPPVARQRDSETKKKWQRGLRGTILIDVSFQSLYLRLEKKKKTHFLPSCLGFSACWRGEYGRLQERGRKRLRSCFNVAFTVAVDVGEATLPPPGARGRGQVII